MAGPNNFQPNFLMPTLKPNSIGAMVAAVEADANITVKTNTEVARIGGAPGDFGVTLKAAGNEIRVGCTG